MFLLNFIRYLRGYVRFEARGVFVERFLNLVAREGIAVWSGCKRGGIYQGCVAAGDYRRLRRHAKKAGVRLCIAAKCGTPFQRRRFRKRTGLLLGLALFLAFLFGMSRFIWRIEVSGNEIIDDMTILRALDTLEIRPGTLRSRIDVRGSERRMLLLLPEISWLALNIDGSALTVELAERVPPPEMVDPLSPCNVVAGAAGQIKALYVFEGQALVKVGDTVTQGDMVVSGITQDGRGQSLFRHARATVLAETSQTLEVSIPLQQIEYVETGKRVKRGYLGVFDLELPLFLPWKLPSFYRVERVKTPLTFFSVELPLHRLREEYILMEESPVTLTEAEARQQALEELANLQQVRLGDAEILDKKVGGELTPEGYLLHAEYFCLMDIAREQPIYLADTE